MSEEKKESEITFDDFIESVQRWSSIIFNTATNILDTSPTKQKKDN